MTKNDGDLFELPVALVDQTELENVKLPSPELAAFYDCFKNRVLYIDFEIDNSLIDYAKYILMWNKEDAGIPPEKRKPIKIMIFSRGGYLEPANMFVDVISLSKTPVYGYNIGVSMSGAAIILIACHKRYCLQNSTVLIHRGYADISGNATDVLNSAENYKRDIEKMKNFIIGKTNITKQLFKKHESEDWFINAQDQLKLGIVDAVVDSIDELLNI